MLNRPSSISEDAIDRLPQIERNILLDEFPTEMDTGEAVKQLSSGKAPGVDAIPAEVYKAGAGGGGLDDTHGRETDRVVSLYVEEGGYPT